MIHYYYNLCTTYDVATHTTTTTTATTTTATYDVATHEVADFVGLTFTPQSVITPIGSVSLVSNLCFARLLLGEEFGFRTLGSVAAIMAGVVTT